MNQNDYLAWPVELEIRARSGGGAMMRAKFPYNRTATIKAGGRVRKERFRSGSMSWQVREFEKLQAQMAATVDKAADKAIREALEESLERRNTHLLVGHDFNRAIADMRTGNLRVKHTAAAVELEADLPDDGLQPSWVRDSVLAVKGGQLRGLSPGFNVTAKGGERLVPETGNPGVMIREIEDAVVYEYSLVARPAYAGTKVDARADDLQPTKRRRIWI